MVAIALTNNSTLLYNNNSEFLHRTPLLAIALSLFSVMTIFGNVLVMLAVSLRANLHTPTGYMILSLAGADLIVGLLVMPFNIVFEMSGHVWLFGLTFCDIWHSLDVLASTASIWNLCVIALDRYLAVMDPLKYPERMTTTKATLALSVVWLGSILIAFPAIAWWRSASPKLYLNEYSCSFTDDLGYLTFSSVLSFYLPLLITVTAYWKIYTVARSYQKCLRTGHKSLPSNPNLQLRIHRGGGGTMSQKSHTTNSERESVNTIQSDSASSPFLGRNNTMRVLIRRNTSSASNSSRRNRPGVLQRLLNKESKAAKTLGVVVSCFVACWLPFFVVNVLVGACSSCIEEESLEFTFTVVTWLGHCNSALNPVIYTLFNREFRQAFIWLLCYKRRRARYSTRKGLAKAIEGSLKVIVPQVSNNAANDDHRYHDDREPF